jgi:hypothetical protein
MADRSEEFADLMTKLETMSRRMTLLCGTVEVRSCLTSVLTLLQLIELGGAGAVPDTMLEPIRTAICAAHEAVDLCGVLIGGVGRLPTDAEQIDSVEGKE